MWRMNHLVMALGLALMTTTAFAAQGLVRLASPHSVEQTTERFVDQARQRGLTIFKRVDHAAGAASVGKDLRPTRVVIFGNPKAGTPLMQCAQSMGIDLPMKALVWEAADGQVWVGYNDLDHLAARHGIEDCAPLPKIKRLLAALTEATVAE